MLKFFLPIGLLLVLETMDSRALAQSISDNSLGDESTRIVQENGIDFVEGGALRNDSLLFHSFEKLSVGRNRSLYFRSGSVEQIFSRITGDRVSMINGVLGTTGNADLYIINPNGIVFGPNSRLDVGGSFVASTASSFEFGDFSYSSDGANTSIPPLLVIKDWGLNIQNPASRITVRSGGHSLATLDSIVFSPFDGAGESESGLRVPPNKSLTLLAGDIFLDGGILTAQSGHINILSVVEGIVNFDEIEAEPLSIQSIENGSVLLNNRSLLDTSGFGGGNIHLIADQFILEDSSQILSQDIGTQRDISGDIFISATDMYVERDNNFLESSGISSINFAGSSGDIHIHIDQLHLNNGGYIRTLSQGDGKGGEIWIEANEIEINGGQNLGQFDPPSSINTASHGTGIGGDISIETLNLNLYNGGVIQTNEFGLISTKGGVGNIRVQASEDVLISGAILHEDIVFPSGIMSFNDPGLDVFVGQGLSGDSGNIFLTARNLDIVNGGIVSSATFSSGVPGNISISAETIRMKGVSPFFVLEDVGFSDFFPGDENFVNPEQQRRSLITSAQFSTNAQEDINLTSGNLSIDANQLFMTEGASITSLNFLPGQSGNLNINADFLLLDQASISSNFSSSGQSGIVSIESGELYILNDSLISSSAAESSDAGVVRLNVDEALVFESFVIANSQGGFAGEVTVLGDSILALNSDFAAESSLGVEYNGSVQISNLIDPGFLYNTLPLYVGIADQPFTQSCSMTTGDSLLFDIRLRKYEQEGVRFDEIWFPEGAHSPSSYPSQSTKMEAIRWEYDEHGNIALIAQDSNFFLSNYC